MPWNCACYGKWWDLPWIEYDMKLVSVLMEMAMTWIWKLIICALWWVGVSWLMALWDEHENLCALYEMAAMWK